MTLHNQIQRVTPLDRAVIIGLGLAGCGCATALSWNPGNARFNFG